MVQDWGTKPFRVVNSWFMHMEFYKFVEDKWRQLKVDGWDSYIVKEKLKRLKGELKSWNKNTFGDLNGNIDKAAMEIKQLDERGESGVLSEAEMV